MAKISNALKLPIIRPVNVSEIGRSIAKTIRIIKPILRANFCEESTIIKISPHICFLINNRTFIRLEQEMYLDPIK